MSAPLATEGEELRPTRRNAYIDNLRGWSIFGVVCVHFAGSFVNSGNAWSPSFYLGLTLNQIFSFAVPLFVFLSGYLAGASRKAPPTLWTYFQSRFWRVVFPYLIASTAAFFLLNHFQKWKLLPDVRSQITWLLEHLFYYGVEPTLYFIPLIILLYVLQPLLRALPAWIHQLPPLRNSQFFSLARVTLILALLFLALHVTLGINCYNGSLNYYNWGRPNPLFWMIYFFSGLHFKTLLSLFSRRVIMTSAIISMIVAASAMAFNAAYLTNRTAVGALFEHSNIDYAYVRPAILIFDLAMVALSSTGIALGWSMKAGLTAFLGRYTLEIYLWHILLLYYGAWRYAETLAACRQIPELIVIICIGTCFAIAGISHWIPRSIASLRKYRLSLTKLT